MLSVRVLMSLYLPGCCPLQWVAYCIALIALGRVSHPDPHGEFIAAITLELAHAYFLVIVIAVVVEAHISGNLIEIEL